MCVIVPAVGTLLWSYEENGLQNDRTKNLH